MYKHILYAVEFGKETDHAIASIKQFIDLCHNPKMSLLHVVEISPYDVYYNIPPMSGSLVEKKKKCWRNLAINTNVTPQSPLLLFPI